MSEPSTPEPSAPGPDDHDLPVEEAPTVVPVDLRDYVDFSPERATRVRTLATDRFALDLWCLEPGQSTPVLRLPDQDVSYLVIGGRSWFVTDEGEVGLDPLGTLLVPAGVVHGIDNRAADPLIVVATVSPPGDDDADEPISSDAAAIHHDRGGPNPVVRAWRKLLGVDHDRSR